MSSLKTSGMSPYTTLDTSSEMKCASPPSVSFELLRAAVLQQYKETPLKESSGIFLPVAVMYPIMDSQGQAVSSNG